ncbi:MAG: hypothetical protein RPV21_00870 [Candidatus Sedimenticola sp. (ex Thyasira tokunagai)]
MAVLDCKILRSAVIGSALAFVAGIALQFLAVAPLIQGTLISSIFAALALVLVLVGPVVILLTFLVSLIHHSGLEHCRH